MPTVSLAPDAPLLRPHLPLWLVIAMACLASFMVVMDGSIVNVALPSMQRDLHLTHETQQWVINAYLVSFGGCMLLAARAGDVFGRRTVLLWGLMLFTLSSLFGGLAGSAAELLLARAVQGVGAAVLATSSMTLVMAATHNDKAARASALSLWAALNSAGFALGVVIGGLLTQGPGWRWVMFVNVPIGALLIAGIAWVMVPPSKRKSAQKLDVIGGALSTLASASLVFGITQSSESGWLSARVLGSLLLSFVAFVGFILQERRCAHPLVRLSIFRKSGIGAGNLLMLCLGGLLAASIFLISVTLQQISGYSAAQAGLAMLPMGLALAAVRWLFGKRLGAEGASKYPLYGSIAAAAGLFWLGFLPMNADFVKDVLAPTLLLGGGIGLVILAATYAVTSGVALQDAGLVSGLANTSRQLGGALGVALLGTLASQVAHHPSDATDLLSTALAGNHAAFFAAALLAVVCGLISLRLKPKA